MLSSVFDPEMTAALSEIRYDLFHTELRFSSALLQKLSEMQSMDAEVTQQLDAFALAGNEFKLLVASYQELNVQLAHATDELSLLQASGNN
jgi:hypothetical protein